MGYGIRDAAGTSGIKTFMPDNTATEFYIAAYMEPTLGEIIDQARKYWPREDLSLIDVKITAEHIQTDCLGYDRYDSCDYTDFLKITLRT